MGNGRGLGYMWQVGKWGTGTPPPPRQTHKQPVEFGANTGVIGGRDTVVGVPPPPGLC